MCCNMSINERKAAQKNKWYTYFFIIGHAYFQFTQSEVESEGIHEGASRNRLPAFVKIKACECAIIYNKKKKKKKREREKREREERKEREKREKRERRERGERKE